MKHVATLTSLALCTLLLVVAPASAQTEISVTPYAGYNTAAGYNVDFDQLYTGDYEGEDAEDVIENAADEVSSVQGGLLVGVGADIALPYGGESFDLTLRPSAETVFISGNEYTDEEGDEEINTTTSQNYLQFSGDLLAEFNSVGPASVTPYAGAGLTYARHTGEATEEFTDYDDGEVDEGDSYSDSESVTGTALGINLLGGTRFPGVVQFGVPFVQLRASVANPTADLLSDLNAPDMGTAITLTAGVSFDL
jgi:opacity protein-like surface antigen